ncbi:MAG: HTTM domain-containing protein [Pirellulales bacterium]
MDRLSGTQTLKQQLSWLMASWDRFFFQPIDALPLSILRILTGCMLLYAHSVWGSVLQEFLGPNGWNSRELVAMTRQNGIFPSFWWYVPAESMELVHYVCNAIIVLYIIGFGGRLTSLLTWIIAISYAHRTAPANFGLDQITCMLTLYLMIAPATQYLSLDRWLRIKLGKTPEQLCQYSASANVASRLIQLHLCVIYLWAGLGKLQGEAWWNGNAMWLAFANYEYQSMDMTWLARYPRLLEFLTHLTIAWELSFAGLVWLKPTRWLMLGLGAGMHLGICMFLGMWTFGSIMIFSYIAFGSGSWIRSRFRSTQQISDEAQKEVEDTAVPNVSVLNEAVPSDTNNPEPKPNAHVATSSITESANSESGVNSFAEGYSKLAAKPSVVLVTDSEQCVQHFLQLNQQADLNWIAAANIKEAEKLVRLLPDATFLLLEMRNLDDVKQLEYLSIRTLRVKRSKRNSSETVRTSESRRVHPK